jgi:hypothetical protein
MNARAPTTTGTVAILNVGAGDTKLSFDPSNPAERIRAARIVRDMIRRGYALLIETGEVDGKKQYQRATDFNEQTCQYIIADFDPIIAAEHDAHEEDHGHQQEQTQSGTAPSAAAAVAPARRGRGRPRKVDAGSASAVAVAPIAGG